MRTSGQIVMQDTEENEPYRGCATDGLFLCVLAAVVMAYGWGYRGVTGATHGAMAAGALLGMAVCLGSRRPDWQRRAAVAGLFGAVGWAWGGSFSYMEQTFYTVSDSFRDVLFGYACLFLLGALWAGIGGAVLGLVFTLPRSRLQRFVGPFAAMALAFFAIDLLLALNRDLRGLVERFTAAHFHDAEIIPALTVVVVNGLYALVRRKERAESALFFAGGVAWWIGYLGLTKLCGMVLGPPFRLETWSGILGVLVVLIVYLVRRRNRAALMLCLYGIVGGGIAFALAVFVRHPVRVSWGPFAPWGGKLQWKIAEESFGLFMGLAIAWGVLRLARGGLAPAAEDTPPKRLDVFAGFFMLVVVLWLNLMRAPRSWIHRFDAVPKGPVAGLMTMTWLTLGGLVLVALVLYGLYLYRRDALVIAPASTYGKGVALLLLLMWVTVIGAFVQMFPGARQKSFPLVDASFIALAAIATAMLLSRSGSVADAMIPPGGGVPPTDARWNVGIRYGLVWASVPVLLLCITGLSMAMQDGPAGGARKRFGADAYWREALRVVGRWEVTGFARHVGEAASRAREPEFRTLEFKRDRTVRLTRATGEVVADTHGWQHRNSVIWLEWCRMKPDRPARASIPMTLRSGRLYIPWPPHGGVEGYWVLERKAGP